MSKVIVEKGGILSIALALMILGYELMEKGKILEGIVVFLLGLFTIYLREFLKYHRWHSYPSWWRGEKIGSDR